MKIVGRSLRGLGGGGRKVKNVSRHPAFSMGLVVVMYECMPVLRTLVHVVTEAARRGARVVSARSHRRFMSKLLSVES